jgi:hypothetical protein
MDRDFKLYRDLTDAMKKAHSDIRKDMELKW